MATKAPAFTKKPLAAAIGALAIPSVSLFAVPIANAQTATATNDSLEMIVVTATRRSESVQENSIQPRLEVHGICGSNPHRGSIARLTPHSQSTLPLCRTWQIQVREDVR